MANGLRYLRVGGRGFCLRAGKPETRKMLENAAESHTSEARCIRQPFERHTRPRGTVSQCNRHTFE